MIINKRKFGLNNEKFSSTDDSDSINKAVNEIYKIDNKKAGNQIKQNTEQEKKEKEPGIRANENTYINMHDKAFI